MLISLFAMASAIVAVAESELLPWPTTYRTDFGASDLEVMESGGEYYNPVVMDPGDADGDCRLYEWLGWDDYAAPSCPYSRPGYEFDGWKYYSACYVGEGSYSLYGINCGSLVGVRQPGEKLDICGISALEATWKPVSEEPIFFSVTFDANGGSCSTPSLTVSSGSAVGSLPTATREGYEFLGWFTSSDGGSPVSTDTIVYANVTYSAHWSAVRTGPDGDYLKVSNNFCIEMALGDLVSGPLSEYVHIESGSPITVSVTGLPSGVKYDKQTGRLTGQAKKVGVYYVTFQVKNTNGYQMSSTLKWTVGGADDGDYDQIGLARWADLEALDNLCVGRPFSSCGYAVASVSGLPKGLKFTKGSLCADGACTLCGDFITGTPTKAGKYKITFTDAAKRKTVKTVIVQDGGSAYLSVDVGDRCRGRGTVSGGGLKRAGTTVKISARPAPGNYFAGWYLNPRCTEAFWGGKSGDWRTASESFVFNPEDDLRLYAKFVTKAEDSLVAIRADDVWRVNTGVGSDAYWFEVDSETLAKVTAKGLPTGVKLSGAKLAVADTSKLKPGTSVATLTAKNRSGAVAIKSVRIVVPNLRSDVFRNLEYEGTAYTFYVGENGECREPFSFGVESGWAISAKGLPPGVKLSSDPYSGRAYLVGIATKAGTYTVTLTAKKGGQMKKATFTVDVLPFPFVGNGSGIVTAGGYDSIASVEGAFELSISKVGKASIKVSSEGKKYSFSNYPCVVDDGESGFSFFDAKGNECTVNLRKQGDGQVSVSGMATLSGRERKLTGWMKVANADSMQMMLVSRLVGLGKIPAYASGFPGEVGMLACPACMDGYPAKTPDVYFKVSANGTVKASGKINGRSISGTAVLQFPNGDGDPFATFYEYKANVGKLAYSVRFSRENVLSGYGVDAIVSGEWYEDCYLCGLN